MARQTVPAAAPVAPVAPVAAMAGVPSSPENEPANLRDARPASLWHNGDFLRLWAGQVISTMGSGISRLALPLLVLALTNSPVQAGLIAAAQNVPFLVLGLPAGALLDRWNRKRVMIVCDSARFFAFGSIPVAWWFGHLSITHLYVVAVIHGTALVFFSIAQLAALPQVVTKGQLAQAHSLNTASEGIATLVSPGVGGFIISLAHSTPVGAALAYLLDSISYLVSVVTLWTIHTPFQMRRSQAPTGKLWRQVTEGLRYIWERLPLRYLAIINSLHRMSFAPVQLTVVVLVTETLHRDATTVGLLFSAAGAGGLLASVLTPPLRKRVPVGLNMLVVMIGHATGLAVVALAPNATVAAAGMFLAGTMETMTGIVQVSYRLAIIPDALQGRVHSSYRLMSFSAVTAGTAAGGVMLATLGPRATMSLLALAIALIALGITLTGARRLQG